MYLGYKSKSNIDSNCEFTKIIVVLKYVKKGYDLDY